MYSKLVKCFTFILQCFEFPLLPLGLRSRWRNAEIIVSLTWIMCLLAVSYIQFYSEKGFKALPLRNDFSRFLIYVYQIDLTTITSLILIQKHWRNVHRSEDRVWNQILRVDGVFLSSVRCVCVPRLKKNKMFLCVSFITCANLSNMLYLYTKSFIEGNDVLYLIQMSSSNIIILFHALNIQFCLISLNIRIELLRTLIRDTMQQKTRENTSDYSKAALLESSKVIYGEIINISNMINDVFGWSIFILIFHYLMEIVLTSYWVCYLILHEISQFSLSSVLLLLPPAIALLEFAIIASKIANAVWTSAVTFRPFLHPFFLGKRNPHGH